MLPLIKASSLSSNISVMNDCSIKMCIFFNVKGKMYSEKYGDKSV